jgi:hypothetical protein
MRITLSTVWQPLVLAQVSPEWIQLVQTLGFPIVVAGVVGWVVITGKVPRQSEIDTLLSLIEAKDRERERLEAQVDAFARQYENVVLPTVHDAIGAIRDTSRTIEQQTIASRSMEETLKRIELRAERSLGRTSREP